MLRVLVLLRHLQKGARYESTDKVGRTDSIMKIPLSPPLLKGDYLSPPFDKGRWGRILGRVFLTMNYKSLIIFCFLLLILLEGKISLSATPLESLVSKKDLPEGWALIDGPHLYTKKTLFEHIDGQAELFFKYGFQKSVFAIYQKKKSPENQVELDIYDMGNILQAFGIFSRFRNEDQPIGIGLDSFSDDRFASFYKGKYFVMLYATESNPSILKQLAMTISLKILDRSNPPKEIDYFPKNGLKSGSIQYFPEGLLGHQFLKRVNPFLSIFPFLERSSL